MPGYPGKEELTEGELTDIDDALRTPVEHPPAEERITDEAERRHKESEQHPQEDYQHWVSSQYEEHQHGDPGSSSGHISGGGRRSPKDREASPQDPELSSLSALSQFSTGLSVSLLPALPELSFVSR
jgi:hypothetical protein